MPDAPASAPKRPTPDSRRGRYDFAQFTAVRRYQPALSFSPDGAEIR